MSDNTERTILCKNSENIFYMRFHQPGQNVKSISNFNLKGKKVIDISWLNVNFYSGYICNEHHITTDSYYDIIIPFLNLFIKDLNFKKEDFNKKIHVINSGDKIFDISYLEPKNKNIKFTFSKNGNILFKNGDFNCLHYLETDWGDEVFDGNTDFHKLFRGSHSCCKVINETIDNDKKIFITGDSMSIPILPILSCYFKEVVFMDNRDGKSHKDYYENEIFDYVIVELWEGHPITKQLGINLQ